VSDLDSHAFGAKIEMFDDALHDDEPRAVIVAGNHPSRSLLNVWGEPPDGLDRMRELKRQFDPGNILNPGRFVAGL
jgi:FAD/FMN-containing dehydrogenase